MTAAHETSGLEIAVIGMAGRFPHASSVDELWHRLQAGAECISRFSDEEMAAARVEPALRSDPNYVNAGGVLEGAELFDAAFFGYSPREASLLDPQHRFLLETAWTALEHAGYAPGTFDSPVGVYGGVGANDYFLKHVHAADSMAPREVIQLANEKDFLATRISYKLNLKGPSLVVQTACSTSLVAIHLACQGLIAGECDMALAGGVTIRLPQQSGYLFQEAGILSPDGHCRAFSARAQGCLPGNGGAMVVLKRLADAVADGDDIQAVIKGSAINNDGAFKVGYTAPGVEGQTRVIRSALRAAGISAETIGYLEAHGTGTVLGDPIEIQAATQAYRQDTDRKQYCAIGSIKANLGHLDAGAGVAGFIKAVLALKHGTLPPTIHGDPPNPAIDFPNSPFFVNGTLRPWARLSGPRRAAVSSFGIGGTNAHVVLEEPPGAPTASDTSKTAELLILSAKSERALDESAANLAAHLRVQPALSLADVALTLRCGRSSMPHRRAVVCRDIEEAAAAIQKSSGRRSRAEASASARLIFMFPGQGSQYPAMGRELYATQPVFRRHVDAAAEILRPLLGFDLRQIVSGAVSDEAHTRLRDTRIAQPAIFTVSHALAQLVMSWGLLPAAMIGHSIGEYVAACLSGVFSFEDALRLVQARGQLMGAVPAGSMMAVALSADEVEPLLPPTLALAAINAPNLSVVSGPADDADAFARQLRERGIDVRPLQTSHAFHSPAMEPILEDFTARVRTVPRREPAIPFVSNLTGTWISPAEAIDPLYWARHLRQTVRFSEGLQKLLEMRGSILLELGPGQTLTTLARRHVREGQAVPVAFPTTRRADDPSADSSILDTLGGLWTAGIDIDWRRVQTNPHARRVPLPTYPFQRERFWLEPSNGTSRPGDSRRSDLADWFSVQSWERLPERGATAGGDAPAQDDSPGQRKLWIVFADAFGLGDGLAARLRATGGDVVTVTAASGYARRSDGAFELSPGVAEHYQRLCETLGTFGREHVSIVHCWTAEPDEAVRRGRTHLEDYQDRGFYSLLFLAQALGAQRWLNSCRITAISSHVYEVIGTEMLCPEKATIAGPLKVIPLEYDRFTCAHVDIVIPAKGTESIQAVTHLAIDALDRSDDAIAVRGRHLWRPKIVPLRLDRRETVPLLKDRGVYLITGGTGGIGLALAEHLYKTVKARLVLVGREAPPPKSEWHRWLAPHRVDAAGAIAHLSRVESGIVDRVPLAPISAIEGLDRTLDRLCTGYVLAFLAHCGVDASEPHEFDRQALVATCRILPKFERLFARMLKMLEAEGIATLVGTSVRFTGVGARLTLAEDRQQAMARYPQVAPLLELLDHCAMHFHLALSGDIPAIGLLFGEENVARFQKAVETVRDHSYVPLCQELVRELLAHVAECPRSGPLRVLEVGGGEGLLTQALLPSFQGRSVEYTFTDIGRSFVVNAERRAAQRGHSFMRFGVLDISRPPVEQGFAPGSFDVIVAFNVMHATRSVAASLAHVRELLAPGGVLVLQESVRPAAWVDLIWGLTDGWWAFEDEPLRTVSPLIALDAWSDLFRDTGFELVTPYPRSQEARIAADTGVVVARKPLVSQAQPQEPQAASHNGNAPALAQRIAALARLEQQGADVEVIAADVADPASMRAAVDRALLTFGTIDGVIHAALVLNDGAMQVKTRDAAATVFAPKVAGTLILKEVCEGLDLDFFVMFSSLVSQLGGAGQVDYCAASHFQDVFAHAERTGLARSVISINWGAWREIGKAFRAAVERGAAPDEALPDGMSPGEGLEAFTRVMASPQTQVLVSPVDPQALIARRVPRAPKPVNALTQADASPAAADAAVTPAGYDADRVAPRTDTERVIARIWQQILGVPQLGVLDNFFDLGGDSMISLQFIAEARKAGLRFTNRQVFEHQTIAELAAAAGARATPAPEREGTA